MGLSDAIAAYLAELALTGRSPRTVSLQRDILALFVRAVGGQKPIRRIKRQDIIAYLAVAEQRGLSVSYIATMGKTLRRFFGWLVESGQLKRTPMEGMRISMGPEKVTPPFTDGEYRRLLTAANTPLKRALILLLADTGLRASEVMGLGLSDLDFERSEIGVMGKGGRRRRVALNPAVQEALEDHLRSRAQVDSALWPLGWDRKTLAVTMARIGHRAGVANCHPHRFRVSWAIALKRQGVDLLVIKELGGWRSLAMVERYTRWVAGDYALEVHRQHPVAVER